jgi:hypothetical protein
MSQIPVAPTPSTGTLRDKVVSVRSKNAGPFSQTFDLFFDDVATFKDIAERDVITKERVAELYGLDAKDVKIFPFEPALAIKISIPRVLSGGDPGDRDVAGGQQFVPLLSLPC